MLEPILHTLNTKKIVLASSSPRRNEILKNMGLKFEVVKPDCKENMDAYLDHAASSIAEDIAFNKLNDVLSQLSNMEEDRMADLIIAADTIVELKGEVFGKPTSSEQAAEFLRKLGGNTHTVHTAVALKAVGGKTLKLSDAVQVKMSPLEEEVIKAYIATDEPLDKAGAYSIQGKGGSLVESIHGDYYTVMGFPLNKFCVEMLRMYSK